MNPTNEGTPDREPLEEEIARVRAARHQISERFGHDPYRLVAHYVERQLARREGPSGVPTAVAAHSRAVD